MTDSASLVDQSDARLLARLLNMDGAPIFMVSAELKAVWRHQLAAPVETDVGTVDAGMQPGAAALCKAAVPPVRTFGEVLMHPEPPLELLRTVKTFAKLSRQQARSPIPKEIPTALYYSCIAAALVRCRTRITGMSDAALERGLLWLHALKWLDGDTQRLTTEALGVVREGL